MLIKKYTTISIFAILTMTGILPSCTSKSSTKEKEKVKIEFLETSHDFGIIDRSSPIDTFDFRFVNTGDYAIVVLAVKPSCECTQAKYDHVPVLPGDTSFIRAIYNGTGRQPEFFNKSIAVTTTVSDEDVILTITGELK